jgi:lupus La protein
MQVEFYFSDSNLPSDKFLLETVGGSKNHPVPLTTLHKFKRMQHFKPFEAIVEAMKDSDFLDLVQEDGQPPSVRRKEPLPEALDNGPNPDAVRIFEDKAMPTSVYAKGFGEEERGTQLDIEKFFEAYGPVKAVRLRRSEDKMFKGSVFAEFATTELLEKFLALDPKPQYNGKDLQIMSKKQYCDQKVKDIEAGKIKPNKPYDKPLGNRRGYEGRDRDFKRKRDRNDDDDRDWRTRRDEEHKNNFRDDKRGGGRDRDRDDRRGRGPGYGAGRPRNDREVEKDAK